MALCLLLLFTFIWHPWWGISANSRGAGKSNVPVSDPKQQTAQSEKDNEKDRLKSVLRIVDTDGDGRISVQELASRTEKSMRTFYKQEADTRIKALDTSKDGKVTWEEYTKAAESRGAFTEQQRKREKRRFVNADLNNDGGLSRDELICMFHPEEGPHMFAVIVEEFMELEDSDKDGYLSFDEYKVKIVDSGYTNLQTAQESFKRLDKDQDGRLNKEELKVWLSAINTSSQATNQAQRQVNLADDNKDGVLSEVEMLNHMELFTAGSKGYQTGQAIKDEL